MPWAFLCCLLASLKAPWPSTQPRGIWPAISACPWPAAHVGPPGFPHSFECSLLKNSECLKQKNKREHPSYCAMAHLTQVPGSAAQLVGRM